MQQPPLTVSWSDCISWYLSIPSTRHVPWGARWLTGTWLLVIYWSISLCLQPLEQWWTTSDWREESNPNSSDKALQIHAVRCWGMSVIKMEFTSGQRAVVTLWVVIIVLLLHKLLHCFHMLRCYCFTSLLLWKGWCWGIGKLQKTFQWDSCTHSQATSLCSAALCVLLLAAPNCYSVIIHYQYVSCWTCNSHRVQPPCTAIVSVYESTDNIFNELLLISFNRSVYPVVLNSYFFTKSSCLCWVMTTAFLSTPKPAFSFYQSMWHVFVCLLSCQLSALLHRSCWILVTIRWECLMNEWVQQPNGAWSGGFSKHFDEAKGLASRDPTQVH